MHVFKDCGRAGRGSSLEAAHAGKLEAQASGEAIERALHHGEDVGSLEEMA